MPVAAVSNEERRLALAEVVNDLIADGLVPREEAERLAADRRAHRPGSLHPLVVIADQKWRSSVPPHQLLTLEALTEWYAGKVGMPYFHVDPLKINFTAVTEIMSSAYAERFKILPVEVNQAQKRAVIATAEPHIREWEAELKRIHRVEIERVFANPLDIQRYIVEFYNLAKSVKGAKGTAEARSSLSNFEQLVELGKTNRQLDANDQHIVNIVDWLWQYAFDQRASDIHIEPRREVGKVRFRIDGVLHDVYQLPSPVIAAMTSRIKILGRMDVVEKRRPQDGRIKTRTADGQEVELRLSTLPTAFGEKLVMRIFDPEVLVKDFTDLGFSDEDKARWAEMTGEAARDHPRHRPDRLGQDDDALLDAEDARDQRGERLHDRGPDRDDRAVVQPDAGARRDRPQLRRGRACADAPGPGHHHGRRDPRPARPPRWRSRPR